MKENENAMSFSSATDPVFDFLRLQNQPLSALFQARSVALIGASDRPQSVGLSLWRNLTEGGFKGPLFAVNPNRSTLLGKPTYKSILDLSNQVDLAVIATPATTVSEEILKCVKAGIPAAIVISAGFKEAGARGEKLEKEVIASLQDRIRIIGPNCLGMMNPLIGLNATFAQGMALPGNVAFLSQSGALCTAVLDWSLKERFGFSGFVSTGSMADIGWGDLIDYFGDDPHTKSIVIYMESVGDARAFLSAARQVSLNKPIIVIKAGRTAAAAKAAASHTGSLTGSDAVLDEAFRRAGVLRVDEISNVFHMADILAKQPLPNGSRLAVLTNAGGPGVLATDVLSLGGGELAELSAATMERLNTVLPQSWSHANPVDIIGDADPIRYAKSLEILIQDPNIDGMLVALTPQMMTNPAAVAAELGSIAKDVKIPIFAAWMGGDSVATAKTILRDSKIPCFSFPDDAVRTFNYMWRYQDSLRSLYETPTPSLIENAAATAARVTLILEKIRASGRTLLTELEAKIILAEYGFPVPPISVARSAAEAESIAERLGYPVVLKLHSETITHKSDVGGVELNLMDRQSVNSAYLSIQKNVTSRAGADHFLGVTVQPMITQKGYELILGSSVDSQFGPVLLFGLGGVLVEVFRDSALGLPPLNNTLALKLMERTKIFRALKGVRGNAPIDLATLTSILVRFSDLVIEQPLIAEIDINPLLASPEILTALDCRIVLQPLEKKQLPRPAIRPYPTQYISASQLKDGSPITLRPIRPEDEVLLRSFHEKLSEQSVYQRYLQPLGLPLRIAHERLKRICFADYDRELTLIGLNTKKEMLGIGRLRRIRGSANAELTLTIRDDVQRQGLGSELVRRLLTIAKKESYQNVNAYMLAENSAMLALCRDLGFNTQVDPTHDKRILATKQIL